MTRSDADKVDGLSKWTYSCGGHAPANGSAARYRSSPFHSSSSSFAIRPLPRVFTFFFFLSRFPFLSSPFLSNVFSSLSLSVTQVRMVAGQFWMAENETGSNGCNSRDAVNATLRRKSRPFFHGNARVKSRRGTRYFVLSVYRSFRRKISCRLRVNIGLATK